MVVTIGATLGKVSSLATDASCNQQITVIEFNERRVHPRSGTYQVKRLESALRAVAPSATLPILAQGDIADVFLALPPPPEQGVIADFLEAFAQIFYKPTERQNAADHAHLQRHLQPAANRFKGLEEEGQRKEFRDKLSGYVKLYAFLSQIIPYADRELEMLYSYGRLLLPHLPLDRDTSVIKVGDEVELQYYRLERVYSGNIEVREGEPQSIKSPTDVGTGKAKDEKAPLSEIIEVLNERFGTRFTEEDHLFFQQIKEKACKDNQVIQTALANPLDKFELGIRKLIEDFMIERMAENDKIVTRYMADRDFQSSAFPILAREIFEVIRGGVAPAG
jgi:type I restriction enzyme, R subunit